MKYDSYKHYILANGLEDSLDNYRKYHEENDPIYKLMNPSMQEQYIKANYGMRFAID